MIDEAIFITSFCEINEVEERLARHAYMMHDAVGHCERRIIYFSEVTTVYLPLKPAKERVSIGADILNHFQPAVAH